MNVPLQHWQVLPHGRSIRVGNNMLTVTGDIPMPLVELPRRMTVVRLPGALAMVEELVAVGTVAPDFKDPDVDFMAVPGTRGHETALMVRGAYGLVPLGAACCDGRCYCLCSKLRIFHEGYSLVLFKAHTGNAGPPSACRNTTAAYKAASDARIA